MSLRWEQPAWLMIALLAVPMAVIGWRAFTAMSPLRRWSALVLRGVLMSLIAAMLAGASLVRTSDRLAVVAVVDVSGSVRSFVPPGRDERGASVQPIERIRAALERMTRGRGAEDLLGVVAAGREAVPVASPTTAPDVLTRVLDVGGEDGTDLASALRTARLLIPPDASGRLVLVSDGVQTRGEALSASAELGGVPVDVIPLRYRVHNEVLVESVEAPARAPAGASVTARVTLRSSHATHGRLRMLVEGREVSIGEHGEPARRVSLAPGKNVVLVPVTLGGGRVHPLRAIYEPDEPAPAEPPGDTLGGNNQGETFVLTPGSGAVLLVDGVSMGDERAPGSTLARTLREQGVDVRLVAPAGVPEDLLQLQAFDLVMLQNVPADAMTPGAQRALAQFVTELGGGLVMIGGPASFGAGAWKGTVIEPILPVSLDLPQRLVMPSSAVVFVMDTSGSMQRTVLGSSRSQQDIANLGAAQAIRSMDKSDLVGLIEFNSDYRVVVPLGANADPEANAAAALSLTPGGGTNLPPALSEALAQLRSARASVRHAVVMSDGLSQGRERLMEIARQMGAAGIRVSSIAVGDEVDEQGMEQIARLGGGEYFRVRDPSTLPRVFVRAVRVVRSPMVREEDFTPAVLALDSALIDGVDLSRMPPLGGLNLTQPRGVSSAKRPGVEYVLATSAGEPVLARWQAGLGQVIVFASDAHRWADRWLDWPGYAQIWKQIVRAGARPPQGRTGEMTAEFDGDRLRVQLDIADEHGVPIDALDVPGAVFSPAGDRADVRLSQIGPGQYQGLVPVPGGGGAGNYVVTLTPRRAGGAAPIQPILGGAVRPAGAEYRALRSNEGLLVELARRTGGRVLELDDPAVDAQTLWDRRGVEPTRARTPLWPVLLPWTLAVALADIATRRLAWDRLVSRRFGGGLVVHADRSQQAAATLQDLLSREPVHSGPPAQTALGDDEAQQLIAQAKRERRARASQPVSPSSPAPVSAEPPVSTPSPQETPAETEPGLLAAKRRAMKKFDDER